MAYTIYFVIMLQAVIFTNGASITKSKEKVNFQEIPPVPAYVMTAQTSREYWESIGQEYIDRKLARSNYPERKFAKNLIIFIGDGMGATTTTAGRIYKGQRSRGIVGEEYFLSFDKFPHTGLAKTYNIDKQVPDSAGTATAIFTGIKSRYKMLGLDGTNELGIYKESSYKEGKLTSIMSWAQNANKMTGFVTTTRVTHATPAATYAHSLHRDWECDSLIPDRYRNRVKDIARQLVEDEPGMNMNVILGGGQEQFGYKERPANMKSVCARADKTNLTAEWIRFHSEQSPYFVTDENGLNNVPNDAKHVLGLFSWNHLPYELVRKNVDPNVPSLTTMTEKAIRLLSKSNEGFVLLVEGGLIDKAHHDNLARLAMEEVSEFDNAISKAIDLTDSETLILVTSDHSHAFTMNGYAPRGNDILGFGNETLSYLTLSYANGPGFTYHYAGENTTQTGYPWKNLHSDNTRLINPYYQHMSSFYLTEDTHGGEDVPIYAHGPLSYMFTGVMEQNCIAHLISYALCIGPQAYKNQNCESRHLRIASTSSRIHLNSLLPLFLIHLLRRLC